MLVIGLLLVVLGSACAKMAPPKFAPLEIAAKRPPRPPARVEVGEKEIEIKEKILFEFGKADVKAESHDYYYSRYYSHYYQSDADAEQGAGETA